MTLIRKEDAGWVERTRSVGKSFAFVVRLFQGFSSVLSALMLH